MLVVGFGWGEFEGVGRLEVLKIGELGGRRFSMTGSGELYRIERVWCFRELRDLGFRGLRVWGF